MDTSIKRLLEVAGVDITKGKAKELCEGKYGPLPETDSRYYTNKNEYFIGVGLRNTADEQIVKKIDTLLKQHGFKQNKTGYEWGIAMGDDDPHGIVIYDSKVLDVPGVNALIKKIEVAPKEDE